MTTSVFNTRPLSWERAVATARPFRDAHPDAFPWPADVVHFLRYIFTDAGGTWCLRPNSKTGTTSTMHFLYHLAFGHPVTGRVEHGLNPDQAAHYLVRARVFSTVMDCGTTGTMTDYLSQALRLTTVRHPLHRALSGFFYLCRSHDLALDLFYTERLRLSALTGFDWDSHAQTPEGFERYLDYLEQDMAHHATRPVDSHFRPQVLNILPDVFHPDLIGRCEDLPAFFTEIAARLDRPVPDGALDGRPRNTQGMIDRAAFDTVAARRRVAHVFAADFEAFGYDP